MKHNDGYFKICYEIKDHARLGAFTASEWMVYSLSLQVNCDYTTGEYETSVDDIWTDIGQSKSELSKRAVGDCLRSLRSKGYIHYTVPRGGRGVFSVQLLNYPGQVNGQDEEVGGCSSEVSYEQPKGTTTSSDRVVQVFSVSNPKSFRNDTETVPKSFRNDTETVPKSFPSSTSASSSSEIDREIDRSEHVSDVSVSVDKTKPSSVGTHPEFELASLMLYKVLGHSKEDVPVGGPVFKAVAKQAEERVKKTALNDCKVVLKYARDSRWLELIIKADKPMAFFCSDKVFDKLTEEKLSALPPAKSQPKQTESAVKYDLSSLKKG
jgi:hypothetical protein